MLPFLRERLLSVSKECEYADCRLVETLTERLIVENGKVVELATTRDWGVGVRVLYKGAWGFSSTSCRSEEALEKCFRKALQFARLNAEVNARRVEIKLPGVFRGELIFTGEREFWKVGWDEKKELLLRATDVSSNYVALRRGSYRGFLQDKWFLNTAGTEVHQRISYVGGGVSFVSRSGGEILRRSYPASFGGNYATGGFEYLQRLGLEEGARRAVEELGELIKAEEIEYGETTLVLTGDLLALQVHESVGHALELDRILGSEVDFAGASWVKESDEGTLVYGSRLMNVTADATVPGTLTYFKWDDEGVPAQRVPLVRKGILVGFLSSMSSAGQLGRTSGGMGRAENYDGFPLVRMTGVNLEPGEGSLDDLVKEVKKGVLIETVRSWSIDDLRLNFHFGGEIGWEIRDGRIVRPVKNPVYTDVTPKFWKKLVAVSGDDYRHWGVPNCGKGVPMQTMWVSHSVPSAVFADVVVGSG